jgi:hypothetical protein
MTEPYVSWKGLSNPIGTISTNIRPFTNKDPANDFPSKVGLPRPLKIYRKGTISQATVKSSNQPGIISDRPGAFAIKTNIFDDNCQGITVSSNYTPIFNITEKPQSNVTNPLLCCNQQRKALLRTRPTNTKLSNNYYQTTQMYLHNRCQTFKQREFNFLQGTNHNNIKPGEPLANTQTYVAQCTNQQCSQVYYKPNNHQFAQQGAVSDSTRLLKLNVDTLNKQKLSIDKDNAASCQIQNYIGNPFLFKQGKHLCQKYN